MIALKSSKAFSSIAGYKKFTKSPHNSTKFVYSPIFSLATKKFQSDESNMFSLLFEFISPTEIQGKISAEQHHDSEVLKHSNIHLWDGKKALFQKKKKKTCSH